MLENEFFVRSAFRPFFQPSITFFFFSIFFIRKSDKWIILIGVVGVFFIILIFHRNLFI
jgi:ABC-type Mn2+/Zn2+ transport system permease subunit